MGSVHNDLKPFPVVMRSLPMPATVAFSAAGLHNIQSIILFGQELCLKG
jgi:hypothetical protein